MQTNLIWDKIQESQSIFLLKSTANITKAYSQYFTPKSVVNDMMKTLDLENIKLLKKIKILEPSAGAGILIWGIIEHLIKKTKVKIILVEAYELDPELFNILSNNILIMERYAKSKMVKLEVNIKNEDFLRSEISRKFNVIISNPPYKKLNKSDIAVGCYFKYVYGQPNLYYLFILKSLQLLDINGIFTVLSPRNYLTGMYSIKIRNYIFNNFSLTHLHTFDSRHIFKNISQEVIIAAFCNDTSRNRVISLSHNGDFSLKIPFKKLLYSIENNSILIPKTIYDLEILEIREIFNHTLSSIGYKSYVGPIVKFRENIHLRKLKFSCNEAPLLAAKNIKNNNIIEYSSSGNSKNFLSIDAKSNKLYPNSNYVVLQKITSKSSKNILKVAVLTKDKFSSNLIAFDNSLIFINNVERKKTLTLEECYGLYCYINTSYFNNFFSLIISTHTINITDLELAPFPAVQELLKMGEMLITSNDYSRKNCDYILESIISEFKHIISNKYL